MMLQNAMMNVVKHLDSTISYELVLKPKKSTDLIAHVDENLAGETRTERRSQSGTATYYGWSRIYYRSSLQDGVTLSSTEA